MGIQQALVAKAIATGFSPAALFLAGERGAWYDPSDLTTLFQNAAGTTPVTTAGQKVMKMLDKSGNGNHMVQSTSGQAPIFALDGSNNYLQMTAVNSQFMAVPSATNNCYAGLDSVLVAAAVKPDDLGDNSWLVRSLTGPGGGRWQLTSSITSNGGSYCGWYSFDGAGDLQAIATEPTIAKGVAMLIGDRLAGMLYSKYNNGTLSTGSSSINTASSNSGDLYRLLLGAYNDSSDIGQSQYCNGRFYGGVVRMAPIDSTTNANLQTWLGARCALTI